MGLDKNKIIGVILFRSRMDKLSKSFTKKNKIYILHRGQVATLANSCRQLEMKTVSC